MVFNRFGLFVTIHSIFLGITSFLFIWTLYTDFLNTGEFLTGALWVIKLFVLIHYVN